MLCGIRSGVQSIDETTYWCNFMSGKIPVTPGNKFLAKRSSTLQKIQDPLNLTTTAKIQEKKDRDAFNDSLAAGEPRRSPGSPGNSIRAEEEAALERIRARALLGRPGSRTALNK